MAFLHPSRTLRPILRSDADPALKEFTDFGLFSYGADYSYEKGFPQIKVGATNEESGGAVSLLATKIWTWGIVPSDKSWSGTPGDNGGGEDVSGPFRTVVEDVQKKGVYSRDLEKYVKKFQSAKGLEVDGVVGPATWKALGYTGKVITGASQRSGGGGGTVRTGGQQVSAAPLPGPDESITDKVWFWPVAILVPTAAVIGGILFWPSKKAAPVAAAAPAAIPVASNPRRRRSKRSKR